MKIRAIIVNPVFHKEGKEETVDGYVYGHPYYSDGTHLTTTLTDKCHGWDARDDYIESEHILYEVAYNPWSNQLPDSEDTND